jgi:hypothetical protein
MGIWIWMLQLIYINARIARYPALIEFYVYLYWSAWSEYHEKNVNRVSLLVSRTKRAPTESICNLLVTRAEPVAYHQEALLVEPCVRIRTNNKYGSTGSKSSVAAFSGRVSSNFAYFFLHSAEWIQMKSNYYCHCHAYTTWKVEKIPLWSSQTKQKSKRGQRFNNNFKISVWVPKVTKAICERDTFCNLFRASEQSMLTSTNWAKNIAREQRWAKLSLPTSKSRKIEQPMPARDQEKF